METTNKNSESNLSDFSAQITQAVEVAAESIVAIDARPRIATSGVLWREGGIIVSTNHTIERDEDITVALSDGRTVKASIVGRDQGTDLAVLKIDDEEIASTLKPANVLETDNVKIGNLVLAVGRTGTTGGATASFGIINKVSGAWKNWHGDEIERFISLDLAIYVGFSGGALVDPLGNVLGINTSAFGRGLALTIPSETVNRIVDILLTKGSITRPYLGIGTQAVPISQILRERLKLEQESGLMLLTVEAEGAAEKAGVVIGDVLLSIDDQVTLDPTDVHSVLRGKEAGNTVKVQILRGGELTQTVITLGERSTGDDDTRRRGRRGSKRHGR